MDGNTGYFYLLSSKSIWAAEELFPLLPLYPNHLGSYEVLNSEEEKYEDFECLEVYPSSRLETHTRDCEVYVEDSVEHMYKDNNVFSGTGDVKVPSICNTGEKCATTGHQSKSHTRTHTTSILGEGLSDTVFLDSQMGVLAVQKISNLKMNPSINQINQCHICNKNFLTESYLEKHMTRHSLFKCSSKYPSMNQCNICSKNFLTASYLEKHMTTHSLFKCSFCEDEFNNIKHLSEHILTHIGDEAFKCGICDRILSSAQGFKVHAKLHYGEKQTLKCEVCDKHLPTVGVLRRHMRTHNKEKPYGCTVCGKVFTRSDSLVAHMRIHVGKKPYECEICGDCFSQRNSLKSHSRCHYNNYYKSILPAGYSSECSTSDTGATPYKCILCDNFFSSNVQLESHMRKVHVPGEYFFRCFECKKDFTTASALVSHLKMHLTEIQSGCHLSVCD